MKRLLILVPIVGLLMQFAGCGPAATVMPPSQFSDEQKAGAAAEYQKVEDEESMGNNKKRKK